MMKDIPRSSVVGVGISALNLTLAQQQLSEAVACQGFQGFVTITGVHGVIESQKDAELKAIHNRSFLSTPDGMPMVWLGKLNGFSQMDRVYGPELMLNVMSTSKDKGHTHFFFGGAEGVADDLKKKLVEKYDGLEVVGTYCPPFRPLEDYELEELHDELQRLKPHFFWVGLSTPKQEIFMDSFLKRYPDLSKNWGHGFVMIGVGAAFDFHSGRIKQAPYAIQRSGFEWLYRISQDPKRLFKRYLISNTLFLWYLLIGKNND